MEGRQPLREGKAGSVLEVMVCQTPKWEMQAEQRAWAQDAAEGGKEGWLPPIAYHHSLSVYSWHPCL